LGKNDLRRLADKFNRTYAGEQDARGNVIPPITGDQTSQPVLRTQFNEMDGRISPDGNWLAYVSDESGKWEVYVQRFLSPGGKWQVSSNGGKQPQWSHNGNELFYVAADQKLMAVAVRPGLSLDPGTPKQLFQFHGTSDFLGGS